MQNRILLIITGILSIVLIIISSKIDTTFFNTKINNNINVKDSNTNKISSMELEEYVIGVVASEMPASFEMEALKAQAIAARTYAVYKISNSKNDFDVVTDVSNQGYITIDEMHTKWQDSFDIYYNKIKEAVNTTKGMVMKYNDKIVEAYYFAMSNGYTEDVSLVFSEDLEYLESVESKYDNNSLNNFEVTTKFTKKEVCQKLDIDCTKFIIGDIERSDTNRVNNITINDNKIKGTTFRMKLGLRSTDFDIQINNNDIEITTRGYGHGVGMSQYGANGMAKAGSTYDEILKHYYQNIDITNI